MFKINNFQDNDDVKTLDCLGPFTVIEYQRDLSVMPSSAMIAYYSSQMNVRKRQVICDMSKAGVTLQAGAMQWTVGDVNATTGIKGVGDFLGKAMRGKVTGESAIKPEYTGDGILVLEPTYKHIILMDMADWDGSVVLDDGLFLACDSRLRHKAVMRSNLSSAVAGGEGLFNTVVTGPGKILLQTMPVSGVAAALARYAASPLPTRVIGFPSYLWFGLKRMEELGVSLRLRPDSQILLAGGWKQHAAQQVDKSVLYDLARKVLGVGEEHIHELFGAVEHPIFYNACQRHHFHIPIYGRILIRDPDTLAPLPTGRVGLVNLISPLMTATPTLSVMTDDLGYLTPGEDCGCGISSPYLTILGRVGMADIQTCAAGASELLGKGEMG